MKFFIYIAALALCGCYSCVFQKMRVSDVIAALKKDPDYLGDGVFKPA